jgi:hypothetical protein
VIEGEKWDVVRCSRPPGFIDRDALHGMSAFTRPLTTGVIDKDSAHDVGCHAEKVSPIPPVYVTLIDES